ncbi:sacsin N-terminal ATP-binding-like domain-containing protein [Microbispora sp. CA-102843]|uniref:sacsin N-terminal ATP-binding-like domain-containing protein n=1 Tax=Microbispora sp. CA-102843 TaxID=3239952 RepID=UPI003D8B2DD1
MFDTARLRDTVLAAWTASSARFREDANAEEDFALGGYRDRLVVELAQNAADAALRAGVPGRLQLTLADGVLLAANVGAPLDETGVEGLSTLRVSGKKDEAGAAGRFGVGFAAVVSVTDAPSIASRLPSSGEVYGVRWSREETAALVAARPELAAELEGREGHVPLLRLPFSDDSLDVPEGYDTLVRLPLRDQAAEQAVRRMLEEAGPALPLSMPALETVEIVVDGRTRTISAEGWHVVAESGTFTSEQVAELFADRPTEERARPYWEVRWAVPGDRRGDVPRVVHAPTPSDEPLDLPALLIASFPMTTDRRHVAPGPLTDFLVARAAEAYVRLLGELPATPDLLDLVPGLMGKGALDAAIRREIVKALPDTPLLPTISEGVVPGNQARAVEGSAEFLAKIAGIVPGLLPAGWASRHPALTTLGVRRVDLADVVDMLSGEAVEDKDPAWWRSVYEVLPADDLEAVGAIPVPLADGRLVRGPRGTLVLSQEAGSPDPVSSLASLDPAQLAPLGLRIVHRDAVHPLLLRLGAAEATPRTVLEDPLTHAAVSESLNSADPEPVAQAVLALVDAAGLTAGEAPWLTDLALRGADGELYAAGELLLAEGSLAGLIDPEVPFGVAAPDLVEKFGPHVLAAAGVLDGFAVVNGSDVLLDPAECDHDLDLEDEWLEAVLDLLPDLLNADLDVPPVVREFAAVRDLEYVADWPNALALLSRPPLRAALRPMRVLAAGETVEVPSYTAWWLSRHPVLGGRRPTELRLPTGDPLLFGLYGEAPAGIDEDALKMIGVRSTLAELLDSHGGPEELLDLLADSSLEVDRAQLRSLWIALAAVDPARVSPPEAVRAVLKGTVTVADVEDGPVVVEAPDLLALVEDRPLVLAPFDLAEALSEVLDLSLAGEVVTGAVTSTGAEKPVPPEVRSLLPGAPVTYVEHDELLVDGRPVPWRFFEGAVHATGVDGLARGLAWAAGQWGDRLAVAALLRDPARVPLLLAEADLDPTASL